MAEKQGFWSSIIHGDEREQELRAMQKEEMSLFKKKESDIKDLDKEIQRLRKESWDSDDKVKYKELIANVKSKIKNVKENYKSDKVVIKERILKHKEETRKMKSQDKLDLWEKEKQRLIEKGYSEKGIEEAKFHWDKPMWQKLEENYTGQKRMPDYEKTQTTNRTLGSIKLEHLGGHPRVKKGNVTIKAGKESGTLQFGSRSIMVTGMGWEEKGKRSGGKAAAGAVVGGIVTAPITWGAGAIVGAAIGGRKKDDSVVAIAFSDGNVNYTMYLKADAKEYQKLCKLLA